MFSRSWPENWHQTLLSLQPAQHRKRRSQSLKGATVTTQSPQERVRPASGPAVTISPAPPGCGKEHKSCKQIKAKTPLAPRDGIRLAVLATRRRRRAGSWAVPALPCEHTALHQPLSQGATAGGKSGPQASRVGSGMLRVPRDAQGAQEGLCHSFLCATAGPGLARASVG